MKKAILGVSAAAVIALVPLSVPLAPAGAGDPCADVTDPAAHQVCLDNYMREI